MTKNSAWDLYVGLRGSPPSSPRGRLGFAEAEPCLPCDVIVLPRPMMGLEGFLEELEQLKKAS